MSTKHLHSRGRQFVAATALVALTLQAGSAQIFRSRQPDPGTVETITVVEPAFVPRVITNVVEVRVPTNIFVNLYRTNQFAVRRTNVFDVFRTNLVTRTLTNTIVVDLTRTNYVTRYRTNLNNLTLTNYETVLVFKTNWVTRPSVHTVQIDLPAAEAALPPADLVAPVGAGPASAPAALSADNLSFTAVRTRKPPVNDQVEISLKLKTAGAEAPVFESQEWQVERTDGSVLLFGQGPEFKRDLPLGNYKVEVKAKPAGKRLPIRVRGFLEVTRDEVVQQKPVVVLGAR